MGTTHISTGENKNSRVQTNVARVFSYIFLAFVTILSLFPILLLIINSTRSNAQLSNGFSLLPSTYFGANFQKAMGNGGLLKAMGNSLLIAAASSLFSVYFSAMTAYGIHVYDFKLKKFAFTFIMVVMMIPTQISAVGFVDLVYKFKLNNTYWPLIIPSIAAPAVFFYMKQYIESALPMEVIEAARVDGSNEFRTFNVIALPMIFPAMAVQLIFAFTASWNNFFTPALIISKADRRTVPIVISTLRSAVASGGASKDLGYLYMVVMLAIVPVVIVYILVSKHIVGGVALGAVKG